jgi:hypothetical protein
VDSTEPATAEGRNEDEAAGSAPAVGLRFQDLPDDFFGLDSLVAVLA